MAVIYVFYSSQFTHDPDDFRVYDEENGISTKMIRIHLRPPIEGFSFMNWSGKEGCVSPADDFRV